MQGIDIHLSSFSQNRSTYTYHLKPLEPLSSLSFLETMHIRIKNEGQEDNESIRVTIEQDNTILIRKVASLFGGATALKYKLDNQWIG
jgi:hypothetical protein